MRTWLITGCSSGIGRGIAEAALENGDQVVLTARKPETVQNLATQYEDRAIALPLDLTDADSMGNAVEKAMERFGQVDVLLNNAGYGYRAAIEESEPEQVNLLFQTNVFGPTQLMSLCLPDMRKRKSGIIINVSSIGAVRAAVGNGYYSASKAALELVSDAVSKEAAELGIRVCIVQPGAFRTNFYDSLKGTEIEIKDYADTAGKMRIENVTNLRNQPGDPLLAGKVIVDMVNSGDIPKHLPLGSDASRIIETELKERLSEVEKLKEVSGRSDFAQGESLLNQGAATTGTFITRITAAGRC